MCIRDRGKDIIISGGENISSIEVEQAIAAHPAVLECAVVGVPHEYWGERPKAFVTPNKGSSATAEEIIAFCRERLAHYKCPDAIEFGPLPKTSTGKIQKFVLRDREWALQDKLGTNDRGPAAGPRWSGYPTSAGVSDPRLSSP